MSLAGWLRRPQCFERRIPVRRRSRKRYTRLRDGPDPRCSFAAPMYFEFFAQVMHVVLNRCSLDAQLATDLLIRQSAIHQVCNLQLAPRQRHSASVTTAVPTPIAVAPPTPHCEAAGTTAIAVTTGATATAGLTAAPRQRCHAPIQ